METETVPQKTSPAKWALLGVLALILGYVLLKPSEKPAPQTAANASPRPNRPANGPRNQPVTKSDKPVRTKPLPETSLTNLIRYNPFEFNGFKSKEIAVAAKPANQATQSVEDRLKRRQAQEAEKKELSQQKVDIILESAKGRAARVGNRILSEGKPLRDGVVVKRIQKNRVILDLSTDGKHPAAPSKKP